VDWVESWRTAPVASALVRVRGSELIVEELNETIRRMAGDAADTFIGMSLDVVYSDVPQLPRLVRRALETGEVQSETFPYALRSAVGTTEVEARAIRLAEDAAVVFLAPAALTAFDPTTPSIDDLQDEAAAAWLSEGEAAAYIWRLEPDGDFTLVGNNRSAVEATRGGVLEIRGLRARSLYFDQPQFIAFLEQVRDEGRAETNMPLRFVTEGKRNVHFFRALGVRRREHLFLFTVDRTEEHSMAGELATAEKRLRRAERLDSLGRLAGGIAHDFNNLLAAIVVLGELIREQVADAVREDVDLLLATADRGAALTKRLLAFARRQEVSPIPFSVGSLLAELQPMLDRLVGSRIDLRAEVEPDLPAVLMDPAQLEQIVVNLVVNAQEAMPKGGAVTLRLREARPADREAFDEVAGERFLLLEVEDEGMGVPEELRELIFEPFVSSKDEGSGGGLGLATVWSLVSGAGGGVRLTSEQHRGSTFHLLLPVTDAAPEALRASTSNQPPTPGPTRARVLLVEDDPLLRRVVHRSLSRDGFEVVTARDGRDALEQLEAEDDWAIDIVVTDVVMPHVSGPELARALREREPDLPIIFCSGHHTEALVDELSPPVRALAKPLSPATLLEAIQSLLGEGDDPG
jgi:signal transduction histidine kinase/CheY-like chemotaxis protein